MKDLKDLTNFVSNKIDAENCLIIGGEIKKELIDIDSIDITLEPNDFFDDNKTLYDIIIVDGYHSYEQSKKDLENALKYLTDKGLVLLHDTFPQSTNLIGAQKIKGAAWCGDVYKTAMWARQQKNLSVVTWDKDYGCSIISKNSLTAAKKIQLDLTFENLHKSSVDSIGLMNLEQLTEYFNIFLEVSRIQKEVNNDSEELTEEDVKAKYKKRFPEKNIGRKSLKTLLRELNS